MVHRVTANRMPAPQRFTRDIRRMTIACLTTTKTARRKKEGGLDVKAVKKVEQARRGFWIGPIVEGEMNEPLCGRTCDDLAATKLLA